LQDEDEAAGHLSRLLFVAVTCGVAMLIFTQFGVDGLLRGKGKQLQRVRRSSTYFPQGSPSLFWHFLGVPGGAFTTEQEE
jgi:hypothetical protein